MLSDSCLSSSGEAFKRMGFDMPGAVQDFLDKKMEFRNNLPKLESILDKYRALMKKLDKDARIILKQKIFDVETCLLPGTTK